MIASLLFPMLSQLVRGRGSEAGPIVLDRRRIYILPTRLGAIFALLLLAMLIGSINYGLSLGYILTFLLGGVAIVGILHTYRNLQGLRIADAGASPAFAGEEAVFHLSFETQAERLALSLRWRSEIPVIFDVEDAQHIGVRVPAPLRGRLKPGRFTLSSVYPLGLFRAWSYVEFNHAAIVYPRPGEMPPDFMAAGEDEADTQPGSGEGGEDFAGLRAWQPSDSPRQVAWKVAARSDQLATKRFSDVEGSSVLLDWTRLHGADTETRLSQLTRWVLDAEQAGLRYGLRIPGCDIAPGNGAAHRQLCLKTLALHGLPEHD